VEEGTESGGQHSDAKKPETGNIEGSRGRRKFSIRHEKETCRGSGPCSRVRRPVSSRQKHTESSNKTKAVKSLSSEESEEGKNDKKPYPGRTPP